MTGEQITKSEWMGNRYGSLEFNFLFSVKIDWIIDSFMRFDCNLYLENGQMHVLRWIGELSERRISKIVLLQFNATSKNSWRAIGNLFDHY